MYKFNFPELMRAETAPDLRGEPHDDLALAALYLIITFVNGLFIACAWLCAAMAVRFVLLQPPTRLMRLLNIPSSALGALKIAGEGCILAFGLILAALSPMSAAPSIALAAAFAALGKTIYAHRSPQSWLAATPISAVILAILIGAMMHGLSALVICGLLFGACFALMAVRLDEARRKQDRMALKTELFAQALRASLPSGSAIWEMDFEEGALHGADQLAALLGYSYTFDDIAATLFGAPEEEHDLAHDVFAPKRGPTRRFFFTHAARGGDGRAMRLEHRGIVHADSWGRPISLSCITVIAETNQAMLSLAEQWQKLRAHYGLAPPSAEPRVDEHAQIARRARA